MELRVKDGDTIAVWFSNGAPSAVASKIAVEKYGQRCRVRIINSYIKEEDEDNLRFLKDVQEWIGVEIEQAINEKYPSCSAVEVWDKRQYMSGVNGAPCTLELKKEARYQWEARNNPDWHVLGFAYDEQHRHNAFILTERENVIPILIEERITKPACLQIVASAGIRLPLTYDLGYENANCIGCVKATSPTYWNKVRQTHPNVFKQRAEQSREIGCRLVRVKGKRIFLDELKTTDTGRPIKNMKIECGIFCEETPLIELLKKKSNQNTQPTQHAG